MLNCAAHLLPNSSLPTSVLLKSFLDTTVSSASSFSKFHMFVIICKSCVISDVLPFKVPSSVMCKCGTWWTARMPTSFLTDWTEVQNRHPQSGDFCFGELTSNSLSSTFPLKTNNWGCSKAEDCLISDSQYRCVPSFHLPLVIFFAQVLDTTWANIFTSSGFTYKATSISDPVSLVPLLWTQTGLDFFHTWSKNACYGSATGITNPDWGDQCVLKKFHYLDSMETQKRNTSSTRQIIQWLKHCSHLLSKDKLSVSSSLSLKVSSIC